MAANPGYNGPPLADVEAGVGPLTLVKGSSTGAFASAGQVLIGVAVAAVVATAVIVGAVVGTQNARAGGGGGVVTEAPYNVTFRLLHINDMHARVEGILATESAATNTDRLAGNKADGGWPKIFTAAKRFVDSTYDPVLFLEDGDQFMGTIWHT